MLIKLSSGYGFVFLERQILLRVLANHVEDQSRVLLNKKVTKIDTNEDIATVYCEDGSAYVADVVVGADGVYSITRREAWRNAELANDGKKFEADKKSEYY
jgi:2-polyprenyl-6-methoxyphenol hydroxylase-like FAD-dependent oxidoreductase